MGLDLKELERKAFRSFYQDGLWDLLMGAALIAVYLSSALFDPLESDALRYALTLVVYLVIVLGFTLGKKKITIPRLGNVKFGENRKSGTRKTLLINFISLLLGFAAFMYFGVIQSSDQTQDIRQWMPYLIGIWIALVTGLMAFFMDFPRMFLYALLYGIAFTATALLHEPLIFLYIGLGILVIGAIIFIRFLRGNPLPGQGESYE